MNRRREKRRRSLMVALSILSLALGACGTAADSSTATASSAASPGPPGPTATSAVSACEDDPFGCVIIEASDPIVIGTALAITGPSSRLGLDSQYGAQVALNLRAPVLGHEVVLDNEDSRCSSDGGTAAAKILRDTDALVAVIGTSCSTAAPPAASMLGEHGILLVSPSNTAPGLTDASNRDPYYVRVAPNDRRQGTALAAFACSDLGVSSAATIDDGSSYARSLAGAFGEAFAERCGGAVSATESVAGDGADLAAVLQAIATSDGGAPPEFLYFPLVGPLAAMIAQQAGNAGMSDTILASLEQGLDGVQNAELMAAGTATEDVYLTGPDLPVDGEFYRAVFLPEYTNVSAERSPISIFHAYAFDAANMLLDAVERVAVQDGDRILVPRSDLRRALLSTSEWQGLSGTLTCDQDADCSAPIIHVSVLRDGAAARIWP